VIFLSGGAFTPAASAYLAKVGNLRIEKPVDSASVTEVVIERIREARRRSH
jgi:hypothetical protein